MEGVEAGLITIFPGPQWFFHTGCWSKKQEEKNQGNLPGCPGIQQIKNVAIIFYGSKTIK